MSRTFPCGFIAILFVVSQLSAQESIQRASHLAPGSSGPSALVKFSQQAPAVGERLNQRVGMELNIHTVIKQEGKVAHDGKMAMRRRQERMVEVLEVSQGRAKRARVSYPLSRSLSPENENPDDEVPQAVEGKEYVITRSDDRLIVTDRDGAIPPREEYDIVVNTMESFGQPNLLAEFLLQQQLQVGTRVQVPSHLANKMMGFDSLGEVQRFELHLVKLKDIDGQTCAVFGADIEALGKPENPLNVRAHGNVLIELATCRTREATLQGPISFLSSEQTAEFSATGNVLLAIRSQYDSIKKK